MTKSCKCVLTNLLLLYDFSARRRSTRLIESPWVYNWPKKAPVYINLDSEESNLVDRQTKNLNKKGTDKGSTMQNRKTKPIRMQSKGEKNLNAKFVRLVNEEVHKTTRKRNRDTKVITL